MKLFITDLDGSLLNSNKQLPNNFIETLERVKETNNLFFIATGRSKEDVEKLFDSKLNFHNYICDNGAIVFHNNTMIDHTYMDNKDVQTIIDTFKENDLGVLVLSGVTNSYRIYGPTCDPKDEHFFERYYVNSIKVNNLNEINEKILKITIQSYK